MISSSIVMMIVPLIILQIFLDIVAIVNISKKKCDLSIKVLWIVVILLVGIIGALIYLGWGEKKIDEKISNGVEEDEKR